MQRHSTVPGWAAGAVAVVGAVSSCSGAAEPEVQENDGVRTFVAAAVGLTERSSGDAEIGGLLTATENNCLAVENAELQMFVVVWPAGVELTSGGAAVTVPGVGEIGIGDTFSAAGSYVTPPGGDALPEIPDECLSGASDEVAVIDDLSTISR